MIEGNGVIADAVETDRCKNLWQLNGQTVVRRIGVFTEEGDLPCSIDSKSSLILRICIVCRNAECDMRSPVRNRTYSYGGVLLLRCVSGQR